MFLSQNRFIERLTQMFRDLEAVTIVERKLQNLVQYTLAIKYTTQFQTLVI